MTKKERGIPALGLDFVSFAKSGRRDLQNVELLEDIEAIDLRKELLKN